MIAPFVSSFPGRPLARLVPNPKLRFLDQCREVLRFKQMSPRTEQSYVDWIRRFIVWARDNNPHFTGAALSVSGPPSPQPRRNGFFAETSSAAQGEGGDSESDAVERVPTGGWRHPKEMGAAEVRGFLTHLAAERNVAAATQNQALNALVFLFRDVLERDLGKFTNIRWAQRRISIPVVFTREEEIGRASCRERV